MSRHRRLYFSGVGIAVLASLLPYTLPQTIDLSIREVISAILWFTGFLMAFIAARGGGWKRWWLLVTAPFALYRTLELLLMVLLWTLNGGFH